MSLFGRLFERSSTGDRENRWVTLADVVAAERGTGRPGAIPVGPDQAMRLGAVWRSVNLLADLVAGFPVHEYRKAEDGRVELPDPPLLSDPSPGMLPLDWRRAVMVSWLLRGNAAGLVAATDPLGYPTAIEIAHPDELTIRRDRGRYRYSIGNVEHEPWPRGDLWHVPAFTVPGRRAGLSPIAHAAESIGLGLAVRRFGSDWFTDGAHPTGVLSTDQAVDGDLASIIKDRFVKAVGGRREPVVLGAGLTYESIQVAPEDSQFLETTRANVADVARYFGVPPELIGGESGGSLTYANVEQRSLDLLTYTVSAWVLRLEGALSMLRPRGRYVKLNTDALVRVSLLDRVRAYDALIRLGVRSRNEIRALDELGPIPDDPDPARGDEFLWPPMRSTPLSEGQEARESTGREEANR